MSDDAGSSAATRQTLTATTFVEIVDTLVGDFDVIDVLTSLTSRCVQLLDAAAAGILLADSDGHLCVVGASNEQTHLLELFQVQNDEGPCLDCFRTGQVVLHSDLDIPSPWPRFSAECTNAGFASVCAVPLRLATHTLGCLNLFMPEAGGLTDSDVALARALADVASIVIVQDQATRDASIREGHLQHALTSRIAIEQAKGMIAENNQVDMDEAFARLRTYARYNNRRLTDVAEAVVAGTTHVREISAAPRPPSSTR
jgi:transcriptional regulator with GAF, ATPase, and Fis domain